MKASQACIDLIKKYEGISLVEYPDVAGFKTIGIGHRVKINEEFTKPITVAEAEELLRKDLSDAEAAVTRRVKVPLKQHEFDALVSFTYNLGETTLAQSTLLAKINTGDVKKCVGQFGKFIYAGGAPYAGLIKRRASEALLFINHKE